MINSCLFHPQSATGLQCLAKHQWTVAVWHHATIKVLEFHSRPPRYPGKKAQYCPWWWLSCTCLQQYLFMPKESRHKLRYTSTSNLLVFKFLWENFRSSTGDIRTWEEIDIHHDLQSWTSPPSKEQKHFLIESLLQYIWTHFIATTRSQRTKRLAT